MAKRWTRRRLLGAAVALVIVGAIGGTVATRLLKKFGDPPGGKAAEVVVLEFSPADLAKVDAQPLGRTMEWKRSETAATGDSQGQGVG